MKRPRFGLPWILLGTLLVFSHAPANAATFAIDNIRLHDDLQPSGEGITTPDPAPPPGARRNIPQVEVEVSVSQEAQSKNLIAKAYFFDGAGKLIQSFDQPSIAQHAAGDAIQGVARPFRWPTSVPANSRQSIYFPLPRKLPATWSLVVVFGNANGVVTASIPDGRDQVLNYPERKLAAKTLLVPDVALGATAITGERHHADTYDHCRCRPWFGRTPEATIQ
jgi:hypothetical protein